MKVLERIVRVAGRIGWSRRELVALAVDKLRAGLDLSSYCCLVLSWSSHSWSPEDTLVASSATLFEPTPEP